VAIRHTVAAGILVVAFAAGCGGTAASPGPAPASPTSPAVRANLAAQMVRQVERMRTATVSMYVGSSGSPNDGMNLVGPVEYTPTGVRADLTGTMLGRPTHVIVVDDMLYVGQFFSLPAGKKWIGVPVGGDRVISYRVWLILDEITTPLTYVTDEALLTGLAFNAAPPMTLDGVSTHAAVVNVPRDRLEKGLTSAQLQRYNNYYGQLTYSTFMIYLGDDSLPRKVIGSPGGAGLDYTRWGSTSVNIKAPSGPQVLVGP
jgi:hypothetical protein